MPDIPLQGREELVTRLAQMLSGYDDVTWMKLRLNRRSTYKRAAETLIFDWDKFAAAIERPSVKAVLNSHGITDV